MKPFRFGLIGEYQSGKSLLTNCLLQRSIATVGGGNATTHTIVNYRYGEEEYIEYVDDKHKHHRKPISELEKLDTASNIDVIDIYLTIDFLKSYILTDMPGFGANAEDNKLARDVLPDIDFAILVTWSDKSFGETSDSFSNLKALKAHRIPYYFVFNCTNIDRWRCDDENNMTIAQKDLSMLSFYPPSRYPLEANGINIVNLMWYWYSICNSDDELTNRKKYKNAFESYGINPSLKKQLRDVSKFELINRLFDMENRDFFELKRSFREEIKSLKNELCPIGTIQAFAFNTVPDGWLICDGGLLSINLFPELYSVIGTVFGGNGESNFAIPDLRGRFIRGWSADGENDPERTFGSIQDDSLQGHQHDAYINSNGGHDHKVYVDSKNEIKYATNTFSSNNTAYLRNPRTPSSYESYKNSSAYDFSNSVETSFCGCHSHSFAIKGVINDTYGEVRVANETRPTNVALIFCIKVK